MTIAAGIHPALTLGTVALKVSDLERSLVFYEELVGLRVLRRQEGTAELTADGETVLVKLREVPNAVVTPRRSASGLYHYALLVPTRRALGIVLKRLTEAGIHVGHSDHYVSEALYITDPDQNGIEIYRDRPRSEWRYDADSRIVMGGDPIDYEGLLREAEGGEWNGLPAGTVVGHVHFHVGDRETARHFYCDLLGFDMVLDLREFRGMFVSAGGYHHHIGLNLWAGEGAPPVPANGTGIDSFTIELPGGEDVAAVVSRLRGGGFAVEEADGAAFVTDPFGIRIKLRHR